MIVSLPTRECGLKSELTVFVVSPSPVTPYAGVWIEIRLKRSLQKMVTVTPYAGVWIEIDRSTGKTTSFLVTPYAGVWIEIKNTHRLGGCKQSLPTRECGLK